MDIVIKTATMNDLKQIQELNLKLSKKEKKEYDLLLDLDEITKSGIKHFKDRISKKIAVFSLPLLIKRLLVIFAEN